MIPSNIYNLINDILNEVSDECHEQELDEGYLIKYEGWSNVCFENAWNNIGKLEEGERDAFFCNHAEEQSYLIIEEEWKPRLAKRFYNFIDGGYQKGGLYGITWALFKSHPV
jgi:hypothetical protein